MTGIRLSLDEQKRMIMDCLHTQPMTVEALAKRMLCSTDTIRKRLRELQIETRMVRVVGWDVRETMMVRIWGVGAKRARVPVPEQPRRLRSFLARKRGGIASHAGKVCQGLADYDTGRKGNKQGKEGLFRLDDLDRWMFSVRGVK